MLAIEVIASSMFIIVALFVGGLAFARGLEFLVVLSHARLARIEARDLDRQLREFNS